MTVQNLYFRGQGKVFVAERDVSGNKKAMMWLGNVAALTLALEVETLEHKESYSGQSLTDLKLITSKKATVSATLESWSLNNLALGLYGQTVDVTGTTVTGEVLPSGLVVGDIVQTAHPKISSVTVKDSAGTPATLVANTDYRIDDADFGRIEILNLASYTQPFTADYTYGNRVDVGMFTEPVPERWLSFHGLNTAATDRPVIIDLFRVSLNPLGQLAMIGDEVGSYEMAGEALVDSTKSASSALGQFGRILDLG